MNEFTYAHWVLAGYRGVTNMLEEFDVQDVRISYGMLHELSGYIDRMSKVRDGWQQALGEDGVCQRPAKPQ